jgi:hypothetical protein
MRTRKSPFIHTEVQGWCVHMFVVIKLQNIVCAVEVFLDGLPHLLIKKKVHCFLRKNGAKTYNNMAKPTPTHPHTPTAKPYRDPNNVAAPILANTRDHKATRTDTPTPRQ